MSIQSPFLHSFLLLLTFLGVTITASDVHVSTKYGNIIGESTKTGVNVFHGVPFASPPIGDLRFRSPVAPKPWTEPLRTTKLPNQCAQLRLTNFLYDGHEDCLYLNVYAPTQSSEPLPVMVFMFGGAYILGDGFEFGLYNLTDFAEEHNVMVVVPNYRVDIFGFLATDALKAEDDHGSVGNYGIQDQRMALHWVQDNIKNFGGDPTRVTIMGQSAGAFSVCHHLSNGQQRGLFSAAIMDSGSCDTPEFFFPLERALSFGVAVTSALGCEGGEDGSSGGGAGGAEFLKCIRSMGTGAVMNGMNKLKASGSTVQQPALAPLISWGPTIDGTAQGLPELPLTAMRRGNHNKVPLLLGSNINDGSIFVPLTPLIVDNISFPLRAGDFEATLHHIFDSPSGATDIDPIMDAYHSSDFDNESNRAAIAIRDYIFLCADRRAARASVSGGAPTFLYQFGYRNEWAEELLVGVFHGVELLFVFGESWPSPLLHPFLTKSDKAMREDMGRYWTNFMKYHDPNGGAGGEKAPVSWPALDEQLLLSMHLTQPLSVDTDLNGRRCDMFDVFQGWS